MGDAARAKITAMFSPEVNYRLLIDTYHAASAGKTQHLSNGELDGAWGD
jgi:hypothetical protein